MTADFLIAIAENDDMSDPEAKVTLREAFDAAGLNAEIEVYEGAQHGWCPPDSAVYHEAQAERAWSRLLALFDGALA
jgi:carboxymethylenebutenolidase